MTDVSEKDAAYLERLVDKHGIAAVLMAVSEICGHKAEHIAHAWQDAALAKRWATLEGAVGVIVPKAGGTVMLTDLLTGWTWDGVLKFALAASLCANLAFYLKLNQHTDELSQLKAWACANGNGNGGHDCGED